MYTKENAKKEKKKIESYTLYKNSNINIMKTIQQK